MTKFMYDKAREEFGNGDLDWLVHDWKWILVKAAYVPTAASDHFISSIGAGNIVVRGPNLAGKTNVAGTFDATDPVVTGVPSGQTVAGMVLVRDTGNDATSRCVLFTDEAGNLPLPTLGADITVNHSEAAEKIARL